MSSQSVSLPTGDLARTAKPRQQSNRCKTLLVRGLLTLSALVLFVIGAEAGVESDSHPAGLFGSENTVFITAFSQQPTAKTYPQPDQGFGGFDSFSALQLWRTAPPGSVWVGTFTGRRGRPR